MEIAYNFLLYVSRVLKSCISGWVLIEINIEEC